MCFLHKKSGKELEKKEIGHLGIGSYVKGPKMQALVLDIGYFRRYSYVKGQKSMIKSAIPAL